MNTLLKMLTGLLAATAAASSMAQSTSTNASCTNFTFDTAFTNCRVLTGLGRDQGLDDATLLSVVTGISGVTGSLYKDNLSILNEPGEKVLSLTDITPSNAGQKHSYELTFKQAVTGPFALTLGTKLISGNTPDFPILYRFANGVSAGDTFSIKYQGSNRGAIGIAYAAVVGATAPVPEPETYALALAGFSVAVWAVRRPKASAA